VYPALAIADEIKALNPETEIAFAGTKERMEWRVVPSAGYSIFPIPAASIRRPFWNPSNLLLPIKLILCLIASWKILRKFKPDVVVGTGGYVSGPLCLVAALSGTAVAIQEQNAYAGITNRLLGRVATVVFVAFAAASAFFPKEKCVFIGNPTRRVLQESISRDLALGNFFKNVDGDGSDKEVIVVIGGSLGARAINQAVAGMVVEMLERYPKRYCVWQTGVANFHATRTSVGCHPRLALLP
jgi:UDP-N-acetylglucosamine--N-acetylmuramyl-(pentapeptide) pyrophosphoryl-undecaprenol N-acetylglucosamine transferase